MMYMGADCLGQYLAWISWQTATVVWVCLQVFSLISLIALNAHLLKPEPTLTPNFWNSRLT